MKLNPTGKRITLLLTSVGGLTGVFLAKHYRKTKDYRIVGCDMSTFNPIVKWVDEFYEVPPVKEKDFLKAIKNIIKKENIDIIVPVSSYDIDLFSKIDVQKELSGTRILTMDYTDHITMHDKELCYKYFEKIGINAPEIYYDINTIRYPCIIKPKKSSGSKNTIVLHSEKDLEYWASKIENSIIIQHLYGKEYTVDCLFDNNGNCLGANVRERIKTTAGGATVSRIDNSLNINDVIAKLESTKKIKGPINFQFKILENNALCVFDFNTRFASGGLALTVKAGFDIPNLLIKMLLGEKIIKWEPKLENDGLTMVRYYEEFFMDG